MEITFDTTFEKKMKINICRANADDTLTVLSSKNLKVTIDLANDSMTVVYKGATHKVSGTIHMPYIIL